MSGEPLHSDLEWMTHTDVLEPCNNPARTQLPLRSCLDNVNDFLCPGELYITIPTKLLWTHHMHAKQLSPVARDVAMTPSHDMHALTECETQPLPWMMKEKNILCDEVTANSARMNASTLATKVPSPTRFQWKSAPRPCT